MLMDRPSQHAIEHGKAIASAMWAADFVAKQPAAKAGSKRKMLDELQAMFFVHFLNVPEKALILTIVYMQICLNLYTRNLLSVADIFVSGVYHIFRHGFRRPDRRYINDWA